MEYSSRFKQEVRDKLESLRSSIDQDLGALDSVAANLTFSQADQILVGATSLLDSYRAFMKNVYQGSGRPAYSTRRAASAGTGPRGKIEPAALEIMQGQGYLLEKEFVTQYGFNRNAASRKLQDLAATYGWQRERSDEGGWRYSPRATTSATDLPTAPPGPSGAQQPPELGESAGTSVEPPVQSDPTSETQRSRRRGGAGKTPDPPEPGSPSS